uniref:Uncharacterized protein n=1 Tax=Drosophila-associated filamentous virus TaxID=2743186 RepID=A0A6M9TZZ5_9VIRU|nr:putative protein 34 [Drosophila-associated filamentous virus]
MMFFFIKNDSIIDSVNKANKYDNILHFKCKDFLNLINIIDSNIEKMKNESIFSIDNYKIMDSLLINTNDINPLMLRRKMNLVDVKDPINAKVLNYFSQKRKQKL